MPMTTRKRKAGTTAASATRTSIVPRSALSRRVVAPALKPRARDKPHNHGRIQQALLASALFTASYIGDVLRITAWLLKKPLGILAFALALGIMSRYIVDSFPFMLSLFCVVPGVQSSALCTHHASSLRSMDKMTVSADFSKLVEVQNSFVDVMKANAGTNDMSLKLKMSEMATRDLVTLVHVSELRSRDSLTGALQQFVEDVRKTGDALHRLSAKIDGAVDRITAVNDYAMRTIASVMVEDSSQSRFKAFFTSRSVSNAVAVRSFGDVMDTLARETHRALLEATASAANLERLHEHLLTIHEICLREGLALNEAHAELLSDLWTILGGNRHTRRKNELHLALLKEVDRYRKQALAHVMVTHDVLQLVAADVEELRECSAAPDIVGEHIPADLSIRSIADGIQRLKEGRQRATEKQRALMTNLLVVSEGVLGEEDGWV